MSDLAAVVAIAIFLAAGAMIPVQMYSIWLLCVASDRQFNRRLAKLRARHVNWREWRRPKTDSPAR